MTRASNRTLKTTTITNNRKTDMKMVQSKKNKTFKKNRKEEKRVSGKVVSCFREEVVFEVLEIIDHLHRRVALERGVEKLRRIQNEAWKIAMDRWMVMKFCGVSYTLCFSYYT